MKKLYFESVTTLKFSEPVGDHYFLLRTMPPSYGGQCITSARLELKPEVPYTLYQDGFGNLNETGSIKFPHDEFIYSVYGMAEIDDMKREKERLHPIYKHPSTHTHVDSDMIAYVESLGLKGTTLEKALQLADSLYHYMTYEAGTTCISTTAKEVFHQKKGVCQDYSHLFIALARYIGIPARYANGLPLGSGPSHAWSEVYVDGIWVGIDPTHNRLVGEDYVRFCTGRDFKDCALERGVLFGNGYQTQETMTKVVEER